jgi:hypothetical protein
MESQWILINGSSWENSKLGICAQECTNFTQ